MMRQQPAFAFAVPDLLPPVRADAGPVVMRTTVPVLPDDTPATLGARVFAAECGLYPEAIRAYAAANRDLIERWRRQRSDS